MTRLEEMKQLATEEAVKLKQHATKQEINSLDFSSLNPDDQLNCIYGQMTGECYSDRALELIKACCTKVYEPTCQDNGILTKSKLNGKPYEINGSRKYKYHSPIECLILDENIGTKSAQKIIAFLKGETKTLKL